MTFQASRHERNNYSFISNWNYPRLFFLKENFTKQETHQPKTSPNQKNITKQTNITNQKNSHQIPYTPFRVNPKQNEISNVNFNHLSLLQPAEVMVLVPRQGCWLSKVKVQSNGKNARPRRRRAMAHGTAFRFFLLDGKKRKSLKISARMLISIWNGKINLFSKNGETLKDVGLFLWVNFGRVFSPNDGWYLYWQRESEMLSTCF